MNETDKGIFFFAADSFVGDRTMTDLWAERLLTLTEDISLPIVSRGVHRLYAPFNNFVRDFCCYDHSNSFSSVNLLPPLYCPLALVE